MNEQSARSLYEQRINTLIESLLPNGAGTITEIRLRFALDQVAQVAFTVGHDFALSNLGTMGGSATSKRKSKTSAENGKRGGRPAKTQPTQRAGDTATPSQTGAWHNKIISERGRVA